MKIITSITTPFTAIIDGSNRYALSSENTIVPDDHAAFIHERWGNLVSIQDAPLDTTIDALQTHEATETEAMASGALLPEEEVAPIETVETSLEEEPTH